MLGLSYCHGNELNCFLSFLAECTYLDLALNCTLTKLIIAGSNCIDGSHSLHSFHMQHCCSMTQMVAISLFRLCRELFYVQNLMQQVRFCRGIEVSQTWLKSLARQSLDPKKIMTITMYQHFFICMYITQ